MKDSYLSTTIMFDPASMMLNRNSRSLHSAVQNEFTEQDRAAHMVKDVSSIIAGSNSVADVLAVQLWDKSPAHFG
jgi:hypothetical protein